MRPGVPTTRRETHVPSGTRTCEIRLRCTGVIVRRAYRVVKMADGRLLRLMVEFSLICRVLRILAWRRPS